MRRRLGNMGYGSEMPPMQGGPHVPLPPPPNGQPPVRLPVGTTAQPDGQQDGAHPPMPTQGGMPDLSQSPEGMLMQILQKLGARNG